MNTENIKVGDKVYYYDTEENKINFGVVTWFDTHEVVFDKNSSEMPNGCLFDFDEYAFAARHRDEYKGIKSPYYELDYETTDNNRVIKYKRYVVAKLELSYEPLTKSDKVSHLLRGKSKFVPNLSVSKKLDTLIDRISPSVDVENYGNLPIYDKPVKIKGGCDYTLEDYNFYL